MSQKGSSIVSSDNPEVKYKKALMQIQKIHNANKVLKGQSQQMKADYQRQINDMGLSLQQLQKQNEDIKNDKIQLEKFLQQLQVSNTELRKEYNNLQRQVTYLNEVLSEQNTQLKKVNAFKDEKGLTTLITSYQNHEINYRKDISRQQELIKSLKNSCETLENDLAEERRQRYKFQQLNNSLRMEISKYREMNSNLLSKNQSIVSGLLSRSSQGRQKYREAENIFSQLGRQLEMVKSTRMDQMTLQRTTVSLESYQALLQQKSRVQGQIYRLRERLDQSQNKSKKIFEFQQKMKVAVLKSQQLHQECNMLKSKLVVVEAKDIMQSSEDIQLKEFQERVIVNITQNDPLLAIKNSSDSSHFQLLKTYIIELKDKLAKALSDKKQYEKKYRSLKQKIGEKADKAIGLQQQNKLLRGKLQGYERLSQRLQFQLHRNIENHEEQIIKMKQMTTTIISKKTDDTKTANSLVRAQLDLQLDKFERVQKGLRQQVQTLKLELSTERIKCADLHDKLKQANQFQIIYKNKFEEAQHQIEELQESNNEINDNALNFEQLYREERAKNQSLLLQKQTLTAKITQVSQQTGKRQMLQSNSIEKQAKYQSQIRKLKTDIGQAQNQIVQLQNNLDTASKRLQEKTLTSTPADIVKTEGGYYNILQQNFQKEKDKNRGLQIQLTTLKLRIEKSSSQSQKTSNLQDALSKKTDELNDVKRKVIGLEKQNGILQTKIKEIRNEYEALKKDNSVLRSKLLENGQQIRKTYQSKDVQSKRLMQKMSQDLAAITSQLREQKRSSARLQTELLNIKNETRRYDELLEQGKKKQLHISQELSQLRDSYESCLSENQRLKSQIKYKNNMQDGMNGELNNAQDRIFKLNQENTEIRLKMQSTDNDYSELRRELGGLKIYLNEIEEFSNSRNSNGGWQQQRDKENLANFVQRLKKILRTSQLSQQAYTTDYRIGNYSNAYPSNNQLPDYLKTYTERTVTNQKQYQANSLQSSPFVINENNYGVSFGFEGSYKYS